jgi:hypothetical protein
MEFLVFGLVATLGVATYALWQKTRAAATLPKSRDQRQLPPPADEERTPATLQVGDIVQHMGTDYLVEGVLTLSEDGRGARLFRLVDGAEERFLYVVPDGEPVLLRAAPGLVVEGPPAGALVHDGQRFALKARATGTVIRAGAVGERRGGERVAVLEYAGAGAARLLVLDWSDRCEPFAGERVAPHLLEILPGK